jgi:hypothetical protein
MPRIGGGDPSDPGLEPVVRDSDRGGGRRRSIGKRSSTVEYEPKGFHASRAAPRRTRNLA